MRPVLDGNGFLIGPWRAAAWSVIRDWVVDWSAFGEIVHVGRFVSVNTRGAPDINRIPMLKAPQNVSFEAATWIGCAAYVPSGKNAWAHLFVLPRLEHLLPLPQHQKQRDTRAQSMVDQLDAERFGSCTRTLDCEAQCHTGQPGISVGFGSEIGVDNHRAVLKAA